MKKLLFSVIGMTAVLGSGLFYIGHPQAEESTQDQYCAPGPETDYEMLGAGGVVRSQTFKPTQNRLSEIDIKIGGLGLNGGTPITVKLYGPGFGGPELATKTILPTIAEPSIRSWTFGSPVTVTPGETYRFILEESGAGSVYWYYGAGGVNCDGQDRTYAFRDDTHMTWDWNYKTLGYTVADPSTPGTTDTGATAKSTTSVTLGETLGTATTAIAKPANLTAAYSDSDKGIKLSWKASTTTDIDGYKVFRSESADKGFAKIKDIAKNVATYLDQDIAASKTYYYQVRAYKASEQSYSSNTASAQVPADIAPVKPKNLTVVDTTSKSITVRWAKSTNGDIKGYTINLYRGKEKIRTSELSPGHNTYAFLELDSGVIYKVELIAKSDTDKTSTPAITFGSTDYPQIIQSIYNNTILVANIAVLIVLLLLLMRTISRKQKKS
jgi:hypothetical protein